MSFELQAVVWTSVLLFALLVVQGALTPLAQGFGWGFGSRDEPKDATVMQGRFSRTIANHLEGMLMFVPLVLVAHLAGVTSPLTVWGAGLYLAGRAAFALLYLGGVAFVRSLAWGISLLGIMLIGFEVIAAAL